MVLVLTALLAVMTAVPVFAQDDPNEVPLGDVARNLRKKTPEAAPVIDDDNLTQVMEQGDSRRGFGSSLRFLMEGENKGFLVSAPDATCSLSFTANVKSLLSSQYSEMELPPADVAKLEGPATIEGDALTLALFNATNWHVSEVAVALTVVKKAVDENASDPSSGGDGNPFQQVRPEKKRDVTTIYRMRAAASPWMRAVFSAPMKIELAPGDEWHWAIVQVRGYPPENHAAQTSSASSSVVPRDGVAAVTPDSR